MYAGKKAGRRRRVRRGLEIDLGGLGYTFPFLNDMLQVWNVYPQQLTLRMIIEYIYRTTLMLMDYSPVTKIDLLVLQMIFQQR